MQDSFVFIGGGHLALSFLAGLSISGFALENITVIEKNKSKRDEIKNKFNVNCVDVNGCVGLKNSTYVLMVKPDDVKDALKGVDFNLNNLISCVAGLEISKIRNIINNEKADIIRCMPNLPAIVCAGLSALYCCESTDKNFKLKSERLFRSIGTIVWVDDESLMHVSTAVSGSGPGYVFRLMQSMIGSAQKNGLDAENARFFVINMFFGAAKMALESDIDLGSLCKKVCVEGGTTIKGVEVLEESNIDKIFFEMINSAKLRSEQISNNI
jgi:pyrroline-5-carboxylate reductase